MEKELDVVNLIKGLRNLQLLVKNSYERDTRLKMHLLGNNIIDLSDSQSDQSRSNESDSDYKEVTTPS